MSSTFDDLAERYVSTWNETDPVALRKAVDDLFAKDARLIDPLGVSEGREAIAATIAQVQRQFPDFQCRLAGPVDGHHDQARFGWELGPDGDEAPIAGFDVVVTDGEGRLRSVLGFLDKVPGA
jgi:SnoaL-like domain